MTYLWHMRTTIELPDALMVQAKMRAAERGMSLRNFFIEAVGKAVAPDRPKVRRPPPSIGDGKGPKIRAATREEIDEAMFG
jgi:hypothetical protein